MILGALPDAVDAIASLEVQLPEGVVIRNENHRILFANSRFVEMTGIPKQDWIGSDSHDEPVDGKNVSAVVAAMDRNVQNGLSEVLSGLDQYFSAHASVASTTLH